MPPSPLEPIKDARQVRALAEDIARLDKEQSLAEFHDLTRLLEEVQQTVAQEEGWVFGIRPEPAPA